MIACFRSRVMAASFRIFLVWITVVLVAGQTVLGQVLQPKCPTYMNFYCSCSIRDIAEVVPVKMCLYQKYQGIACNPCPNHLQDYISCSSCPESVCPICSPQIFGLNAPYSAVYNSIKNPNTIFFRFSLDRLGVYFLSPSAAYSVPSNRNELIPSNLSNSLKQGETSKYKSIDFQNMQNMFTETPVVEKKEEFAKIKIIHDNPNFQADNLRAAQFRAYNLPDADFQASQFASGNYPAASLPSGNYPADSLPSGNYPDAGLPSGNYPAAGLPSGNYLAGRSPFGNYSAARFPSGNYLPANVKDAYSNRMPYFRSRRDLSDKAVEDYRYKYETLERMREFGKTGSNLRNKKSYEVDSREYSDERDLSSKLPYNVNDDKYKKEDIGKYQMGNMAHSDIPMELLILESERKKSVGTNEKSYKAQNDDKYIERNSDLNFNERKFVNPESVNIWNFKKPDIDTKPIKLYVWYDHSRSFKNLEKLNKDKKLNTNHLIGNEDQINPGFFQNYEGRPNWKYSKESKSTDGRINIINDKSTQYSEDGSNIQYILQNDAMKSNPGFQTTALTAMKMPYFELLSNGIVRNKCVVNKIETFSFTYSENRNVIPEYEFMCTVLKKSNKFKDIGSNILITTEDESKNSGTFFSNTEILSLVEDILRCLSDKENGRFTVIPNESKVALSNCQFSILPNFMIKLIKNNNEINFENKSKFQKFKIIQTLFNTVQLEISSVINYIISPSYTLTALKDVTKDFYIITGRFNFEVNLLLQSSLSSIINSNQPLRKINIKVEPTHTSINNKLYDNGKPSSDLKSNLRFSVFTYPFSLLESSDAKQKYVNDEIEDMSPKLNKRTSPISSKSLYEKEISPLFTFSKQLNKDAVSKDMPSIFYYRRIFFDSIKNTKPDNSPVNILSLKISKISDRNETELTNSDDEQHKKNQTSNANAKFKISSSDESGTDTNWFNFFSHPTIDNILSTMSLIFSSLPFHSPSQKHVVKSDSQTSFRTMNFSDLFQIRSPKQRNSIFDSDANSNKKTKGPEYYRYFHIGNTPEKSNNLSSNQMIFKLLNIKTPKQSFDVQYNESLSHNDAKHLLMADKNDDNVKDRQTRKYNQTKSNVEYINENSTGSDVKKTNLKINLNTKNIPNLKAEESNLSLAIADAKNQSYIENESSKQPNNMIKQQTVSNPNQKYIKIKENTNLETKSSEEGLNVIKQEGNHRNGSNDSLSLQENHIKVMMNKQNTDENEISHGMVIQKRRLLQLDNTKENEAEDVGQKKISGLKPSRSKRSMNLPHNDWCSISQMTRHGNLECTVKTYKKECILTCHDGFAINGNTQGNFKCMRSANQWHPKMEACTNHGGRVPGIDDSNGSPNKEGPEGEEVDYDDSISNGENGGVDDGTYYDEINGNSNGDDYEGDPMDEDYEDGNEIENNSDTDEYQDNGDYKIK